MYLNPENKYSMKMFDDSTLDPYDTLLITVEHVEHLSGIVAELAKHANNSQAEIARLRGEIIKLHSFNRQLTKTIKELTDYVTEKKS